MRKHFKLIALVSLMFVGNLVFSQSSESAKKEIESVLVESYVEGVFRNFNKETIRKGFHKDFNFHIPMLTPNGKTLQKVDLERWMGMLKSMSFENIEYKLIEISVTENAAITINEIYQNGKKLYTDYMIWQNDGEAWKIMGKVFASHQKQRRKQ